MRSCRLAKRKPVKSRVMALRMKASGFVYGFMQFSPSVAVMPGLILTEHVRV